MAKKCEQHTRIPVLVNYTVNQSAKDIKVSQFKKKRGGETDLIIPRTV